MSATPLHAGTIVDFLGEIFRRRGAESYLGEAVTMSEHMLQGAWLAEEVGASEELIAAALLHDIGHYTGEFPENALEQGINNYHDVAGAEVIADFFPPLVIACVRWHVEAKRYLCATDPAYFQSLSAASVHSLGLQGGAMSDKQAEAFRRQPYLAEIVQVRRWDDAAKVAGRETRPFAHYAPILQRVVDRRLGQQKGA